MWKIRAPQKLKIFLWLVVNEAHLTNVSRMKKGLSAIDLCPICGIYSETTLHVPRDCEIAKDMWKSIGNSLIKNSFFEQPLKIQLEENLLHETKKCQGIEWPLVFLHPAASFGTLEIYLYLKVVIMLMPLLLVRFLSWPRTTINVSS